MDAPGGRRGLLKPEKRLQWKQEQPASGAKPAPKQAPPPKRPALKGQPSNALSQSQFTLEQVQKMAAARGLSVEKLLAQMVQQYLKED
ncbi:MAG TPA: hypothetical protein VK914_06180 [bacterium]|jgi:hypothetical protein|nr:hypothetical protein [bacterium]